MHTSPARGAEPRPEAGDDTAPVVRWDRVDAAVVVVAAIATVFLHPIHLVLSRPYWVDEAWVATLTRLPWSRMARLSSSTPVAFVGLLKLVPGSGLQRARIVVLVFSAASAAMAYVLARAMRWRSLLHARLAGVTAALTVMLSPVSLGRNDLKQYTCDAFCALTVLVVAMRADRRPGRAPVVWLGVTALLVLPFSSTSAFVSAAAFGGLIGSALLTRSWRRAAEIGVIGAVAGAVLGVYFGGVIVANTNAHLREFWHNFYLGGAPWHILRVTASRLSTLAPALGMPAAVFIVLFILGIAALARRRERAVAIALPVLWIEMMAAGRLRRYPFLDLRTSHFLLVSSMVVIAVGVFDLVQAAHRRNAAPGITVGLVLAGAFVASAAPDVREVRIPYEDVRSQTVYVAQHRKQADVILVNSPGNFGFSYYWPHGTIQAIDFDSGQGFQARVAGLDAALYVPLRTYDSIYTTLRDADARRRANGAQSRLFIVRTHMSHAESDLWNHAIAALHLRPRKVVIGRDTMLVVGPR